jgi:hypothetical protein
MHDIHTVPNGLSFLDKNGGQLIGTAASRESCCFQSTSGILKVELDDSLVSLHGPLIISHLLVARYQGNSFP